jgi:hypothetical protein
MNKQQMEDREQFRRYAEAALSAINPKDRPFDNVADEAFKQATMMMLTETKHWEAYQLLALEAIVEDERARHDA